MDINKILNADYLDILFEGRNKKYGGYDLRKKYRNRMLIAGLIAILLIGGAFAATLIKPKEKVVEVTPIKVEDVKLSQPPPVDPEKPPPPPPPSTPPPPVKPTVKFTPPVIKKNEEVREEDKPQPPKPEENKVVGPTNIKGSDNPDAIDPNLSNQPSGEGKAVVPSGPPPEKIFRSVEQMPEPPGGMAGLNRYLSQHIQYPQAAKEEGIEGRVVLQFVVYEDGRVGDIKIVKDIGGGCGAEAVRVMKNMPRWKPGKQNGQPVKVYYTVPVAFQLK